MLGAVRLRDFVMSRCKGKSPGPFYTASAKTFVDGRGAVRQLDKSFPGTVISGSRKVFIDGRPAVRLKDTVICGKIVSCSATVFYG